MQALNAAQELVDDPSLEQYKRQMVVAAARELKAAQVCLLWAANPRAPAGHRPGPCEGSASFECIHRLQLGSVCVLPRPQVNAGRERCGRKTCLCGGGCWVCLQMAVFDEQSGNLYVTELGRVASHFYIR